MHVEGSNWALITGALEILGPSFEKLGIMENLPHGEA